MNDPVPVSVFNLFSEDDFLTVCVEASENNILMSRVDQMLCDEAEHGRVHGEVFF